MKNIDKIKAMSIDEMAEQKMIIPFGKYKGKSIQYVLDENPKYLLWLKGIAKGNLLKELEKISQDIEDVIQHEQEILLESYDL